MKALPLFHPNRHAVWIALLLGLAFFALFGAPARADEEARRRLFVPLVASPKHAPGPPPLSCDLPGTNYTSLSVIGEPLDVNPETDPNLNLGVRGYKKVTAPLKLVDLGPVHDGRAPQFAAMFGNSRMPAFTNAYQADPNPRWEVTLLGMGTRRGEVIFTPGSGYDIEAGYEYLVMYAGETRITLHIGREDEFYGYVVHIEDVCVDRDLLALYRQRHAEGRRFLPALRGHQAFGVAMGGEVKVAIRDWGGFLDPRSRNDWWQGR